MKYDPPSRLSDADARLLSLAEHGYTFRPSDAAEGVFDVLVEPAYTRTSFEGNVYQADQQLDVYQSARANAEGVLRDGMKTADTPELVASAVVNASTEANPRRRYTAGRAARQISLLRRFVPASAFDRSLRKQMRLPA